jgi:hypothetical protein
LPFKKEPEAPLDAVDGCSLGGADSERRVVVVGGGGVDSITGSFGSDVVGGVFGEFLDDGGESLSFGGE